jgi:hypothetical protein
MVEEGRRKMSLPASSSTRLQQLLNTQRFIEVPLLFLLLLLLLY